LFKNLLIIVGHYIDGAETHLFDLLKGWFATAAYTSGGWLGIIII
jgi:hypothetical protein